MNFDNFTIKAREAIQQASEIAVNNKQQVVETGHLLKAILHTEETVASYLFKKLGVDAQKVEQVADRIVDNYPKSEGQNPYLSNDAAGALQNAQGYLKEFGDEYVALEHIILGLLKGKDQVAQLLKDQGIKENDLKKAINELRGGEKVKDPNAESTYQALDKYAINLNERAQNGKLDPVIGRDDEIRRVLQILTRRTKNNPVMLGNAGVGKTAIVEGIAQRIISGDVPENLQSKTLYSLDMGQLVAGAKYKGEFEERLKSVIKEVTDSDGEILLFIDEIHTLIGAGGGEGAMDAANLLKPALARGELHCIGATTMEEYQKNIENDKALERRFQAVMVDEPTAEDSISILRGIKDKYEVHHGVRIRDEAIINAVELSQRYITERFLPDKAIDLMDEAASKLRIEIDSMPEQLDEVNRRIMQLEVEREAIKKEDDQSKLEELNKELADLQEKRDSLKAQWESEKEVIEGIQQEKENIEQYKIQADQAEREGNYEKVAELRYGRIKESEQRLQELQQQMEEMQKDGNSLLKEEVTAEDIAEVVARWTGIPVSKMLQSDREKLLHLEDELGKRVAGQEEAIQAVSDAVRRSRAGIQDPKRPLGSFIFLGTTGVGKTELAKSLAEYLFNDENNMIRIDMSEYQERHSVSRLVGSPPGYVGYEEGGQLTEAVRRKPYSVILLDEIEKAHHDVFNILLQVLDDGRLTDNKGRLANFKNTIIIMTSNIGSHIIQENFEGYENKDENEQEKVLEDTKQQVFDTMKQQLRPEFLNRVDELVMFKPLMHEEIRKIVELQLNEVQSRMAESSGVDIEVEDSVKDYLARTGFDPQFGARPLNRVIQRAVLNPLSKSIISGEVDKDTTVKVTMDKNDNIRFENVKKEEKEVA